MAFLKGLNIDSIKGTLEAGVKTAQDGLSSIRVDAVLKDAREAATAGVATVGKAIESATRKAPEEADEQDSGTKGFVALLWCLAYSDGMVTDAERGVLDELSRAVDENYETYSFEIEQELALRLEESAREFGHGSAAKIEAQKIVEPLGLSPMESKLLCWNLFALANSDDLDESELDLIRFIGEKTGVEPAVFEEFKNYSYAIVEIEKSIEELKRSNRSYGEIEPLVNEFGKREKTIVAAAQALVADR